MTSRLANKIAVITGSSSGIGREIALSFASHGATIICSDLREEARIPGPSDASDSSQSTTVQAIKSAGGHAIFVKCDTTKSEEVEALVNTAVKEFGRLDIMVNNAGISVETGTYHGPRPVWDYEVDAFEKTMQVNVRGVFLGIKYASKVMKDQSPGPNGDRGWIVNLASVLGLGGSANSCMSLRFFVSPLCQVCSFR